MQITSFLVLVVLARVFRALPWEFGWFSSALTHCFCALAYLPPAVLYRWSTYPQSSVRVISLDPTALSSDSSNCLFCSPYLSSSVRLAVLSSFRKQSTTHTAFDMIGLSKIDLARTDLISSLTRTSNSPLSAQLIVIWRMSSSKHCE